MMTETAVRHTPGNWQVHRWGADDDTFDILVADRLLARLEPVADGPEETPLPVEEIEANARLIAAAPELLAALTIAVNRIEIANRDGDPILSAWLPAARAAIAKAEGR